MTLRWGEQIEKSETVNCKTICSNQNVRPKRSSHRSELNDGESIIKAVSKEILLVFAMTVQPGSSSLIVLV